MQKPQFNFFDIVRFRVRLAAFEGVGLGVCRFLGFDWRYMAGLDCVMDCLSTTVGRTLGLTVV